MSEEAPEIFVLYGEPLLGPWTELEPAIRTGWAQLAEDVAARKTLQDPHPPHPRYGWTTCPTPPVAHPGDEWTCGECGRKFLAALDTEVDNGTFEWVLVPT